jgi:hypothetical protein
MAYRVVTTEIECGSDVRVALRDLALEHFSIRLTYLCAVIARLDRAI